jgi:hypothetical protein
MLRVLNVSFRLLVCTSFIVSSWPAVAQQPPGAGEQIRKQLADQQGQISELESVVRELRAQNSVFTDLLKGLVSNQAATSKAAELSKANPAELKQQAEKALPKVDDALKKLGDIPDDLIDSSLKQRIQSCIKNVKTAAETQLKATAPNTSALTDACKEVDQRAILAELEKAKKDALAKWEKCRTTLERVGAVNPASLPLDPSGLSLGSSQDVLDKIQKLKEVYGQTKGDARDCIDTIDRTFKQIGAQQDAASAMSMALGMAAQVCAASGGNPYVCAGILVVAILMNLFKGGGGGGGDGDGPENSHGAKGKDVASGPLPGGTPAPPDLGNFGNALDGAVACNSNGKTLTCWLRDKPQMQLIIDPDQAIQAKSSVASQLASAITQKQANRLLFCTQPSPKFLAGILLSGAKAGEYYAIRAVYEKPELTLSYMSQSVTAETAGQRPEAICSLAFRPAAQ